EGLRVGWLELGQPAETTVEPVPEALASAAGLGVLRAVSVGGGRSVAVKPMRGEPVLRDLLREHFRGCSLVLVRGGSGIDAPGLEPSGADGGEWRMQVRSFADRIHPTAELVASLRSPKKLAARLTSNPASNPASNPTSK
ncbi:MAG: hypothetical protein ABUL63_03510, partial [Acidobacteriota bacterium]